MCKSLFPHLDPLVNAEYARLVRERAALRMAIAGDWHPDYLDFNVGEPCDCALCDLRASHWAAGFRPDYLFDMYDERQWPSEPDAHEWTLIEEARDEYVRGHIR